MSDGTAVWFDLDGTLLSIDDYGRILERACESVGIDGEDRTVFVEAYDEAFFDALQSFRSEPYSRAARVGIERIETDADPEAFIEALATAECAESRVPDAVRKTLAALDDYTRGVLTNGVDAWQRRKLAHHALDERVDEILVSETVGAHKPDRAVFAAAADAVAADDHWMVGDSREADMEGARAAGWHAIHVGGPDDLPSVLDHLPD